MLKLTVRAGEYINIGEDIRLVFAGGATQTVKVLIDAPKKYNIVRSDAVNTGTEKAAGTEKTVYYKDRDLSPEAKAKIKEIIVADRKAAK
ncbi:MAG: carbon storage regulator [Lachnospiraceae bacterium]|nr:carbon storage regulator [Lachnospiraceae bacterium]